MKARSILLILGLLFFLTLPIFVSSFYVGLATKIIVFALFALSLDLLVGHAGLFSLGHAAYFGIAAYTCGLLAVKADLDLWIALPLGVISAGITGIIFGLVSLRAKGSYFLMITLALAQVLWGIAVGWRSLTGGEDGLSNIPSPSFGNFSLSSSRSYYYFTLFIAGTACIALLAIIRSPFGCALRGIRESETRMSSLGYNVYRLRLSALVIASLFAGLAGCLFLYANRFVGPDSLHLTRSAEVLLMVIAGGAGTLAGPLIGAVVMISMENFFSAFTERWLLVLGSVYILVTIFAPKGIMGLTNKFRFYKGEK